MRALRPLTAAGLAGLALLAPLLLPSVAGAEVPWKTYGERDGMTLQRRPVEDSAYWDLRVLMVVDAPPAEVEKAIWTMITADPGPNVQKREVISRTASEVVVYDRIRPPVVSDRDVTVRIRKVPRNDGKVEVRFDVANELGPPPSPRYVRIPRVRGRWQVEPRPDGKSHLTYECFSEAGGSVPPVLVRGPQQDQVHNDVKRMLGQLKRQPR